MYRLDRAAEGALGTATSSESEAGFIHWAGAAVSAVLRIVGNRMAVRRMAVLDDRLLADIGLCRSDISSALAQPLWVDPSRALVETVENKRKARFWGRALR